MHRMEATLVHATSQQTRASLLHRYDPDGPITLPQHIERADVLGKLSYAHNKQLYWALVPAGNPITEEILSTVSTIVRKVLIQGTGESPAPSSHTAFSITHVYTPKELRKKGYATKMMALLHGQISTPSSRYNTQKEQDGVTPVETYPTGILSFLYSGVGDFYSRCGDPGWHIQTSTEVYWDVESVLSHSPDHGKVDYLTEDDFVRVAQRDALLLTEELTTRARNNQPQAFAVLPTGEEFAWLVARSRFYGKILSPVPLPMHWGIQLDDNNFAIWFIDYTKHELQFLRTRCVDGKKLMVMVHAAAIVAKQQGCQKILAWNLNERLLDESKLCGVDVMAQPRRKNLAAVAWYGSGSCPAWITSEKYGWC
ncbi:hypothetical protein NLJ89_g2808 [Agrocybe chaxingu]|uniref:LYC1 C-terminal domain-containing protein n=1 Tax=Agrocybe chaxingu TaxID=84603 RepID=A0A9W8KBW2_9AGAR|nr:hypothetical protein NLJ89_g2808 [Agrocybe chaxingu]